jgi:hypothetical protein
LLPWTVNWRPAGKPAPQKVKISLPGVWAARNAVPAKTFGNSSHGGCARYRQIKGGISMSKLLRKPEAVLWILSVSQAAGMLALNIVLRAAVS